MPSFRVLRFHPDIFDVAVYSFTIVAPGQAYQKVRGRRNDQFGRGKNRREGRERRRSLDLHLNIFLGPINSAYEIEKFFIPINFSRNIILFLSHSNLYARGFKLFYKIFYA